MNNELSTQLTELAKRLGTSVDQLYAATMKQAKIQMVYEIIQIFVSAAVVAGIIMLHLWLPGYDKDESQTSLMELAKIFTMIAGGVGVLVFILSLAGMIKNIITLYSNPEYWAMQDILASIQFEE